MPNATLVLDWVHIAMRFEHALQAVRGLTAGTSGVYLRSHPIRELESSRWKLWHGCSSACLGRLARLSHWFDAAHVRAVGGAAAVRRHINDLIEYLCANRLALVNYGRRHHDQLPISTAFVESAVNKILSKRMIKKQQMRWNRWTVQPFLDVRVAVLNKTLVGSFRRLYPDFRSDNEDFPMRLSGRRTPRLCMLSSKPCVAITSSPIFSLIVAITPRTMAPFRLSIRDSARFIRGIE
jgi:hypothetical protein